MHQPCKSHPPHVAVVVEQLSINYTQKKSLKLASNACYILGFAKEAALFYVLSQHIIRDIRYSPDRAKVAILSLPKVPSIPLAILSLIAIHPIDFRYGTPEMKAILEEDLTQVSSKSKPPLHRPRNR